MTDIVPTTELEVYRHQIDDASTYATSLKVQSVNDYQEALVRAKAIKERLELITGRKEKITKPLNETIKSVRDLFRPLETKLEESLRIIKDKMLIYTDSKERDIDDKVAKIEERVAKGTMKSETAEVKIWMADNSIKKTVFTDAGRATTKKVKRYYVIDKTLIPYNYLVEDMVKIKASFKAGIPVPGVEERVESEISIS